MKYQRSTLYITLFITVLLVSFSNISAAATLFCTVRDAPLYFVEDGEMRQRTKTPSETLAVGTRKTEYQSRLYHYVIFPKSSRRPGWICESDLREFKKHVEEETEAASGSNAAGEKDFLPLAVRQHPSAKVKRNWKSIQRTIKNNETLPEDKRVPEPYFTRAGIWMEANNYPGAMKDYITALRYASSSGRELQLYARYHSKIETTINRFTLLPAPPTGVSPDAIRNSASHFASGVTAFRLGNHKEAIDYFSDAISVVPDKPLYWYFRSIASKRLGKPNKALYDAVYGTFVERKQYTIYNRQTITINLQYIQGADRIWLERLRLGDPSARIIRSALKQVPR